MDYALDNRRQQFKELNDLVESYNKSEARTDTSDDTFVTITLYSKEGSAIQHPPALAPKRVEFGDSEPVFFTNDGPDTITVNKVLYRRAGVTMAYESCDIKLRPKDKISVKVQF